MDRRHSRRLVHGQANADILHRASRLPSCPLGAVPVYQILPPQSLHKVMPGLSQTVRFQRSDEAPTVANRAPMGPPDRTVSRHLQFGAASFPQILSFRWVNVGLQKMVIPTSQFGKAYH